jgi:predicted RNA-binding Zn-ribbon protein involved in translation (DUF1610 family)
MDEKLRYFSKRKPAKCPNCGSRNVLGIRYGMASMEMAEEAQAGKFVLGGCCITPSDPYWECTACGTQIHNEEQRTWFQENQDLL